MGRLLGGAIRLSEPGEELLAGEGMETTGSAAAAFNVPGWALLSARNLSLFSPPQHLKRLIVATDDDKAGHTAFQRLRQRLPETLPVERALPPHGFNDWNDWARAQR